MIFRKLFEGVSKDNPYIEAAITMFENDESAEGIIVSVKPASDKKDKKVCRLYHSEQEFNTIYKKLQQTYGKLLDVSALHDRTLIAKYKQNIQRRKDQENEDRVQSINQSFNTRFENILKSNGLQYDTIIDTLTEKKYLNMYQQYVPKHIPESEEEQVKIINNFIKELKRVMNTNNDTPNIDVSTLQKFITLTKRLNKQLFFKDSSGNIKRVAPSKYDYIKPEQLANVFVTKTGKEEMSLASIIPQLKQDSLIEKIERLYEETNNMNNLVEDRKDEQPSDMITTRRYSPIPLSYRDRLKELGFESAGRVAKWFKEYKGYCITVIERTNRQKLVVFLSEGSVLKIDPTRGKKLVAEEVYTEEQLVSKIKELESKIDTFRKDPYGRDQESIYEQMNKIDDSTSLNEKWNVKNQRELKKLKESFYDDEDDYVEEEEWNWDGLKDDIDVNMSDVRLNGKKPFEYDTEVIDDDHIHIIVYIENDDGKTLTRYEADLVDMYAVPEYSSGVVNYIEDLPWEQTGVESIDESLTEDAETSNAVMKGIDKVIKDTTAILEEASPIMEGGFVEYFDKYKQYMETQDIDKVKNSLDEFIKYINIKFIDRINFFKNQL